MFTIFHYERIGEKKIDSCLINNKNYVSKKKRERYNSGISHARRRIRAYRVRTSTNTIDRFRDVPTQCPADWKSRVGGNEFVCRGHVSRPARFRGVHIAKSQTFPSPILHPPRTIGASNFVPSGFRNRYRSRYCSFRKT